MARKRRRKLEGIDSAVDKGFAIVGYAFNFLFRGSYRRRFLQDFAEHVRIIVERRLPLAEGIERLGEGQRSLGTRYVVRSVADLLRRGVPFHEALRHHSPTFFPRDCVSMVRAGEISGMLPQALGSIVEDLTFHRDVKVRYTFTCAYLGFLLLYVSVVSGAILTRVLPMFASFWKAAGAALPAPTRMVIEAAGDGGGAILFQCLSIILPIVVLAVFFLSRFELGIPELVASCLPGVKGAYVHYQRGRFFTALGLFLGGKIPMDEAVAAAAEVSRLRRIRRMARHAGDRLREGVSLGEVLGAGRVFAPDTLWRIRSAERRGDLPHMLTALGSEEQEAGHRRWVYLLAWFRPISIIAIGILEFFFVLATYAPLFQIGDIIMSEYL